VLVFGLTCSAQYASAAITYWTYWTSFTAGNPGGDAHGTLGPDGIGVTYTGDVRNVSTQVNTQGNPSIYTNYWDGPAYTSATVSNGPPAADVITLSGTNSATVNTVTFGKEITDPVLAIVSLGGLASAGGRIAEYQFDRPFVILSSGAGHFGEGPFVQLSDSLLEGGEGNGVIQFSGRVSSFSWTVPNGETRSSWQGFTIGAPVPEPKTYALMGIGIVALAVLRMRRLRQST
jgi:hypothetical protein